MCVSAVNETFIWKVVPLNRLRQISFQRTFNSKSGHIIGPGPELPVEQYAGFFEPAGSQNTQLVSVQTSNEHTSFYSTGEDRGVLRPFWQCGKAFSLLDSLPFHNRVDFVGGEVLQFFCIAIGPAYLD